MEGMCMLLLLVMDDAVAIFSRRCIRQRQAFIHSSAKGHGQNGVDGLWRC